jgi:hypothetical protein
MIFDEKSQKLPQTGSSCISVTVNDRDPDQNQNGLFLMIFDEKSQKLPQTGSSCISVTVNDRESGPKPKWSIFDDF